MVDDNMDLTDMKYECENYSSVYTPENKKKLDSIIGKELSEGFCHAPKCGCPGS